MHNNKLQKTEMHKNKEKRLYKIHSNVFKMFLFFFKCPKEGTEKCQVFLVLMLLLVFVRST